MSNLDLRVDPDALDKLATDITRIASKLRAVDQKEDFLPEDFGNGVLLSALHKFTSGWKDGRKEIVEDINALSDALKEAAQNYRELDMCFNPDGTNSTNDRPEPEPQTETTTTPGSTPGGGGDGGTRPRPGAGPGSSGVGSPGPTVARSEAGAGIVVPTPGDRTTPPTEPGQDPNPGPGAGPIPTRSPQIDDVIRIIGDRNDEIERRLGWIGDELDRNEGDTLELINERERLIGERDRLERIRTLLDTESELTVDGSPTPPDPYATVDPTTTGIDDPEVHASRDLPGPGPTPVPGVRSPLMNQTVRPVIIDPTTDGRLVMWIGDPQNADNMITVLSRCNGDWDQVLGGDRLGDPNAWRLADAAATQADTAATRPDGTTPSGATTAHVATGTLVGNPTTAVLNVFDAGGTNPDVSSATVAAEVTANDDIRGATRGLGSTTASIGSNRIGARLADITRHQAGGRSTGVVVHDSDVSALHEAIDQGAPIDSVAVIDGSDSSIRALNERGISAAAVDPTGVTTTDDAPTSNSDPLGRLLGWIRLAFGGLR